ncbi:lysophospholipid acyltransferase family protein [Desulfococcaceae bacterium HSG8]|nr:lysophospholipid acyltransferase family protein [Desulfococcaceae bacterium HSG8]
MKSKFEISDVSCPWSVASFDGQLTSDQLTRGQIMQSVFIISWTILMTIFFASMMIIASFINSDIPHKIAGIWAKSILLASCVPVRVRGISNLDPARSYIYMANHQSLYDIPVLLAHLPVQFRWLAKTELFRIPIFGQAMYRAGYISIDRSDRKSAFNSLKMAAETIRNGVSVLIFPEGTRSKDGNIVPFKKGGFVLAVDSGVPVVPVIIHGTGSIMAKKDLLIRPGDVILEIRTPVETSVYTRKTKNELMEEVRQTICESFEKERKD